MNVLPFADETITRVLQTEAALWYAVLDAGDVPLSLDFACAASTPEAAIAACAARIRADVAGERDRFSPRLTPYDLLLLHRWWARKAAQSVSARTDSTSPD